LRLRWKDADCDQPCGIFQEDKQSLEARLKKTEEDLSRQLTYAQQVATSCTVALRPGVSLLRHTVPFRRLATACAVSL